MAVIEKRACDIFGTTSKVVPVLVTVEIAGQEMKKYELDMCPRAIKRLEKALTRGTTAPKGNE